MKKLLGLGLAGMLGFAVQADAAVIGGVLATASSELVTGGFNRAAANVVSGAGFTATYGAFNTAPEGNMWLTNGNGAAGGTPDFTPSITFDLGAVYDLTSEEIWNYNEASGDTAPYTSRGIASALVSSSTDGITYSALGTIDLTQAPGTSDANFGQTFGPAGIAEFIRLSDLTSFGSDNGFIGLSQVQFSGIQVQANVGVPEPATLAIFGFASFIVFADRRRFWM